MSIKEYMLTSEDIFYQLYRFEHSLRHLNRKMCQLEKENKKETSEFQKYMTYYKDSLKDIQYFYCQLTRQNKIEIYEYLQTKHLPPDIEIISSSDLECIKEDEICFKRIYNRLKLEVAFYEESYKDTSKVIIQESELKKVCPELLESLLVERQEKIDIANEKRTVWFSLDQDQTAFSLSFLQNQIEKEEDNQRKDQLIEAKYAIVFMNQPLEEDLLNTEYHISNDIYIHSELSVGINEFQHVSYYKERKKWMFEKIREYMISLIKTEDIEYSQSKVMILSILRTVYFQSLLQILDDESVEEIKKVFERNIDSIPLANDISIKMIQQSFVTYPKDREKRKNLLLLDNVPFY